MNCFGRYTCDEYGASACELQINCLIAHAEARGVFEVQRTALKGAGELVWARGRFQPVSAVSALWAHLARVWGMRRIACFRGSVVQAEI
eukprot:7378958-Prymnesium_polylepis.1